MTSYNHRKTLKEFNFFDVTLAESYTIQKVRTFVHNGEVEMIFTMVSSMVDLTLTAYATLTKTKVAICRSELIGHHTIRMSEQAKITIRERVKPIALSIGSLLLQDKVGEYARL